MRLEGLPTPIGIFAVECKEMMFYQYLPIKMAGDWYYHHEPRLNCFKQIIKAAGEDFIHLFGLPKFLDSYIYVSAKHLYQSPGNLFNRPGYHSDGFMTNDINYIWSDSAPTIFNSGPFHISPDENISMKEMESQAMKENEATFPNCTLIRLDQSNIHRVADVTESGLRAFLKISFSTDKYDLIGNSHNYELDYNWDMKPRLIRRNVPQTRIS